MITVNDRVHHTHTRLNGTVLEVKVLGDNSREYLVQRDEPLAPGLSNEPTWWSDARTVAGEWSWHG